jgi:lipopolysaccharide transport system ATP-binding protein
MINIRGGAFSYPKENYFGRSIKGQIFGKRGSPQSPVFSNLNVCVKDGDVLGLYGSNGSGKTTLLKLFANILYFDIGEINLPSNTGCLIDINMGIEMNYTGYEALLARAYTFGLNGLEAKSCAKNAAKITQLGHKVLSQYVKSYSTGMQMRLGFSIAMSVNFDCILLDEWLSVGDIKYQEYAAEILKNKITQTAVVVLASHNINLLNDICTDIIFMDSLL